MHTRIVVLLLLSTATAQSTLTIPAIAATREGNANIPGPGFADLCREQFLFGQSHLTAALGHDLVALRLRRNGSSFDYKAGRAHVTVLISASPLLDVHAPSPVFADNHHAPPTTVFDGPLDLLESPRLPRGQAPLWITPDAVTIPFATPFRYAGGTLCIQLDGRPDATSPPDWFAIDAERDLARGMAIKVGHGCGPVAPWATSMAGTDVWMLRPGSTPHFVGIGEPHTLAVMFLGPAVMDPGIDLTAVGAPGCILRVLPLTTIPAIVGRSIGGPRPGGASVQLRMPGQPGMLGATFGVQWAYLSSVGLATSDALAIQLAATASTLDGAVVISHRTLGSAFPDQGTVNVGVIAAVQIEHRQ